MSAAVHILWEGSQLVGHSFAQVNRRHCLNLLDVAAVELSLLPYEPDQFSAGGDPDLERLMACDIRNKGLNLAGRAERPHLWIKHTWPPRGKPPGREPWAVMLPWEYSLLPERHVATITGATEIWTPSSFSAAALRRSGVEAPVTVVPNGVDTRTFHPGGRTQEPGAGDPFTFLYVGGTIYRKGVDLLLEAYHRAFSAADPVRLVVKDYGAGTVYRGQTAQSLIERYQARKRAPAIDYRADDVGAAVLADLYRASDVLVSPYRGEGFSLPTLEAMACGTPVIVTAGGATDDFVDAASGWQIPSRPLAVGRSIYGDRLAGEGYLLEPDVERLTAVLREVLDDRAAVAARGRAAAERARGWTWAAATRTLLERVDAICGTAVATAGRRSSGDGSAPQ